MTARPAYPIIDLLRARARLQEAAALVREVAYNGNLPSDVRDFVSGTVLDVTRAIDALNTEIGRNTP